MVDEKEEEATANEIGSSTAGSSSAASKVGRDTAGGGQPTAVETRVVIDRGSDYELPCTD